MSDKKLEIIKRHLKKYGNTIISKKNLRGKTIDDVAKSLKNDGFATLKYHVPKVCDDKGIKKKEANYYVLEV